MIRRELPWFEKTMVLLNGIIGAIVIGVSLIVFFTSIAGNLWVQIERMESFEASKQTQKGIIVDKISPEGDDITFTYEFVLTNNSIVEKWESFSEMDLKYNIGQKVEIESDIKNPEKKRIKHMKHKYPVAWEGSVIALLMFIGFTGYHLFIGYRTYKYVIDGGLTHAEIIHIEETSIKINDDPLYKVHLKYLNDKSVQAEVIIKSTLYDQSDINTKHYIFYNLNNNQKGMFLEKVPYFAKKYIWKHWINKNKPFDYYNA